MAKKVLIIDDDPDILDSIKAILDGSGFTSVTAMSGSEGVEAFKSQKPDLVLCDMMMESIDEGMKVAGEIRKIDSKVPMYLLSSIGAATASNVEVSKLGFNGVFQKPVEPGTLVSSVKKALGM